MHRTVGHFQSLFKGYSKNANLNQPTEMQQLVNATQVVWRNTSIAERCNNRSRHQTKFTTQVHSHTTYTTCTYILDPGRLVFVCFDDGWWSRWTRGTIVVTWLISVSQELTNPQLIFISAFTSGGETVFSRLQDRASTHGPGYCSSQPGREANQVVPIDLWILQDNNMKCLLISKPTPM